MKNEFISYDLQGKTHPDPPLKETIFGLAQFYLDCSSLMSPADRKVTQDILNGQRDSAYVEVGTTLFYLSRV